ncbi:hypothetical protein OG564_07760 [Streptomyces sp. NBC_01280]|uniref:hypothetical protein n=1 Tax=Streptomyces sp. NBC_01280 TaxID=2903810 RepID=UPI002E33FFBC|nr:hypothetical protein [Streptomyces sp. NBC_01280]
MEMVDWRGRPRPLGAGDVAVRCRIDFNYVLGLELEDPAATTASCPRASCNAWCQ